MYCTRQPLTDTDHRSFPSSAADMDLVRADIVLVPLVRDMPVYVCTVLNNNSTELQLDTG